MTLSRSPPLPQLLFSLPPSVHRSISPCECHLPSELATLGLGLGVRAPFTLTGGFVFPVNLCVSGCVCVCVLEENVRELLICYISERSGPEILSVLVDQQWNNVWSVVALTFNNWF